MVSFVSFARIAVICVDFHLGTLHGYFFHKDFWPNLNFPLEYQIKLVLKTFNISLTTQGVHWHGKLGKVGKFETEL